MTNKKKRPSARAPKPKLEVIECPNANGGHCAMQIAACEMLAASMAKVTWEHRDNPVNQFRVESIFLDVDNTGNYIFYATICCDSEGIKESAPFHEFLIDFQPSGEISMDEMN
jgi:hypothetical protein